MSAAIAARILMASCVAVFASSASRAATPDTDQHAIVDAVSTMFVALTHDDLAQFHRVTCPGFYAYDTGKRFTGDELAALVKKLHGSGYVFVWNVTEPEVHVGKDMAWITYVNRGSFTHAAVKKDATWLESATFERSKDGWCIAFLHSTQVPEN
jgi:hypothetical protein